MILYDLLLIILSPPRVPLSRLENSVEDRLSPGARTDGGAGPEV